MENTPANFFLLPEYTRQLGMESHSEALSVEPAAVGLHLDADGHPYNSPDKTLWVNAAGQLVVGEQGTPFTAQFLLDDLAGITPADDYYSEPRYGEVEVITGEGQNRFFLKNPYALLRPAPRTHYTDTQAVISAKNDLASQLQAQHDNAKLVGQIDSLSPYVLPQDPRLNSPVISFPLEGRPSLLASQKLTEIPANPSFAEIARIAEDTLGALRQMHRYKIAHGDIKPANVMLDAEGLARIIDFGTIKYLRKLEEGEVISNEFVLAANSASKRVLVGITFGTDSYAHPLIAYDIAYKQGQPRELLKSFQRMDVYSWGLMLWEMLARQVNRSRGEFDQIDVDKPFLLVNNGNYRQYSNYQLVHLAVNNPKIYSRGELKLKQLPGLISTNAWLEKVLNKNLDCVPVAAEAHELMARLSEDISYLSK